MNQATGSIFLHYPKQTTVRTVVVDVAIKPTALEFDVAKNHPRTTHRPSLVRVSAQAFLHHQPEWRRW